MFYCVGLGNPGENFEQSRHNVGFMVLDALRTQLDLPAFTAHKKTFSQVSRGVGVTLVKPQTFMNKSGEAVQAVGAYYKDLELNQLYVVHDDLDLALGTFKINQGKGPKAHNGLLSLYEHLKSAEFWHVRVGVDNRDGNRYMPGQAYVLGRPSPQENELLAQTIERLCEQLKEIFREI